MGDIGIINNNGTVESIFCNYNSLEGISMTLLECYKTSTRVRDLIALGDLYEVKCTLTDTAKSAVEPIDPFKPVMYKSETAFWDDSADFCNACNTSFLFKNGDWYTSMEDKIDIDPPHLQPAWNSECSYKEELDIPNEENEDEWA